MLQTVQTPPSQTGKVALQHTVRYTYPLAQAGR